VRALVVNGMPYCVPLYVLSLANTDSRLLNVLGEVTSLAA